MTEKSAGTLAFDQGITFLMVSDMAKSRHFYETVLTLPLVLVQSGGCRIYRISATAYLGLCDHVHIDEGKAENVILCLVADNVDDWALRLQSYGINLEKSPQAYEKFDIYHLMVRDPDGYLVEIQRFNDDNWLNLTDAR
jgi:catechol 2,3-dioxygenase-like lactoylglutathione lyase family enzyme